MPYIETFAHSSTSSHQNTQYNTTKIIEIRCSLWRVATQIEPSSRKYFARRERVNYIFKKICLKNIRLKEAKL